MSQVVRSVTCLTRAGEREKLTELAFSYRRSPFTDGSRMFLGAELQIDTIDGKVKWTLPAGTQTGTTFRLRGKGVPMVNGRGRGDQYVTVRVQVPGNFTEEQREALRAYAETMGEGHDRATPVKDFFEKKRKKK